MKKHLLTLAYLAVTTLGLIELITFTGVVESKLFFSYSWFCTAFVGVLAIARVIAPKLFSQSRANLFTLVSRYSLPLFLSLCVLLFGLDSIYYPNFSFSNLHLNPFVTLELSLLSIGALVLTAPVAYLKKYWQILILIIFLVASYYMYAYYPGRFTEMSMSKGTLTDDNFMEWLQVWVLLAGAVVSLGLALTRKQPALIRVLAVLGMLVFIILAGEELSWGERIIELPDAYRQNNYQNEVNLHNKPGFNEATAIMYFVAFFYAFGSWLVRKFAQSKKYITAKTKPYWDLLAFRGQEVWYFVPTLLFNPYMDRKLISGIDPILDIYHKIGLAPDFFKMLNFVSVWREAFEVLFYAGLTLHVGLLFVRKVLPRKAPRG